jgi:L-ascorbate metabolism protein UlaG (beta-lactamase superfamily)
MASQLTWLGHNCWSIVTGGHRIVLDPFLDDSPVAPMRSEQVEADFVLVSHGHEDHMADAEKLLRRCGATLVANYEICQWFAGRGVEKTHAMNLGGGHVFPFGHLKMTLAHHSSMLPDGSYGGNPCGFVLSLPEGRVYFACDTGLFVDMRLIGLGGLALAALPIGDNFTMGPDDALEAVRMLQPDRVVPVHRDTWPLIAQDVEAWAGRVRQETAAEPVVLVLGGKLTL